MVTRVAGRSDDPYKHTHTSGIVVGPVPLFSPDVVLCVVPVLRSMVTAMGFQILVGTSSPIKPVTDTTLVTLEVREQHPHYSTQPNYSLYRGKAFFYQAFMHPCFYVVISLGNASWRRCGPAHHPHHRPLRLLRAGSCEFTILFIKLLLYESIFCDIMSHEYVT